MGWTKYLVVIVLAAACACWFVCTSEAAKRKVKKMQIDIKSSAFKEGEMIPKAYTCDGKNASPPLTWNDVPVGAKSLTVISDDPDAPSGDWVHWVLFNLPPNVRELPENVPTEKRLASGALQGTNDSGKIGYSGPCPPSGTHRYYFRIYALDTELKLEAGARKPQLLETMKGHIVGQGQLMGRYSRK